MKTKLKLIAICHLLSAISFSAFAQGTAFTYQGRLTSGANVANGSYDLRFQIFDGSSGNGLIAGPLTNSAAVTNGLFTVLLDFGGNVFPGADRWLEIGARTNGGGAFATLSQRQKLTATPYAITAGNVTGSGGGLTNVNAVTLGGLAPSQFWKLAGNAGTTPGVNFLGTPDNQPLELKVNGARALRLEPDPASPNVVGGASVNTASGATGGTIGGGGTLNFSGMAFANVVSGLYGTVSGGLGNGSSGFASGIGSGFGNLIEGQANYSVIAGGAGNWVQSGAQSSGIGAGYGNTVGTNANYGFIGGGTGNTIQSNATFATIGGGNANTIQSNTTTATIGGGANNTIQANASYSAIGGGILNTIQLNTTYSTIGGGYLNMIQTNIFAGTIAGGYSNAIQPNANLSTIGGGFVNLVENFAYDASIGGGYRNTIQSNAVGSTIGGGIFNMVQTNANGSTIAGGGSNTIQTNASYASIGGGFLNVVQPGATHATISGGHNNTIQTNAAQSSVGGGEQNAIQAAASHATIAGGRQNTIQVLASESTIGGGYDNTIQTNAYDSGISGGAGNTILMSGHYAAVGGGLDNACSGLFATVPGGNLNVAAGTASFAAGSGAQAAQDGCFVWADYSSLFPFASTAANQFLIRAGFVGINRATQITPNEYFGIRAPVSNDYGGMYVETAGSGKPFYGYAEAGAVKAYHYVDGSDADKWKLNVNGDRITVTPGGNVGIGNTSPTDKLMVVNAHCDGATWINASDRNLKIGFTPIEPRAVLERVAALPIQQWSYKDSAHVAHLGPVAQDFKAAFGLGADDTSIATVDESGVALVAIQGLNQKLEEQRAENAQLKQEVGELKKLMNQLNQRLNGGVK